MRSDQPGRRDEPLVEVSRNGDAIVVRAAGELDLHTSGPFREALLQSADAAPGDVVVDLADVEFMDSTTLAILLEARGRVGRDRFRLAAPGVEARRALEVSGLDRHFRVFATVEEALAATP